MTAGRGFGRDSYARLVADIAARNRIIRLCDWPEQPEAERFCILRHDVDLSPRRAMEMAEWELEAGVQSTYFFLLNGPFYNLLEREHCNIPAKISAMGHEVGLHYDIAALQAGAVTGSSDELFQRQVDVLSALIGKAVVSIAPHQVSLHPGADFRRNGPWLNAYDPRVTKDIAYYSDSCGGWRDSAWHVIVSGNYPDRMQLLTHPFFWVGSGSRWEKLACFLEERKQRLQENVRIEREGWTGHQGVIEHDRRHVDLGAR
jgi:hypothetical protein